MLPIEREQLNGVAERCEKGVMCAALHCVDCAGSELAVLGLPEVADVEGQGRRRVRDRWFRSAARGSETETLIELIPRVSVLAFAEPSPCRDHNDRICPDERR